MESERVSGRMEAGRFAGELLSWERGKLQEGLGSAVVTSAVTVHIGSSTQRQESASRRLRQDGAQMCQACVCNLRHCCSLRHEQMRMLTLGSAHESSHWLSTYFQVCRAETLMHKAPRGRWKEEGKWLLTMYCLPGSL